MGKSKLIHKPLGSISRWTIQYETENGTCEFEVLEGFGAGLNAWRVPQNGETFELLRGYTSEEELLTTANDTNAGCRLSPFPGRVNNAAFTWNGQNFKLKNNVSWCSHAVHGFLQNVPWHLTSFYERAEGAYAVFECDFPGNSNFPFPYRATTTLCFKGNYFSVNSAVENLGETPMPYSEGYHPYYYAGKTINTASLKLPPSLKTLVDSADIPTGKYEDELRFQELTLIGDTFFNDCFVVNSTAEKAEIILACDKYSLTLGQELGDEKFKTYQLYTPPTRDSIAIEPMTAEPDALNHHRNLIVIYPGEKRSFNFDGKITF